jgi:hypothetical protein
VYHKYAYNQGGKGNLSAEEEKKRQEDEDAAGLKEEVISQDDVMNKNLVRKNGPKTKKERHDLYDQHNYYLKIDDKIMHEVEDYGFPREYVLKCLGDNINNHCTTSYYLLCMD